MAVFPVLNLTSSAGIPTANEMKLRKRALDVLEKDLMHMDAASEDEYGLQQGRVAVFYRPDNFSAASVATDTEGDLKTALQYTERVIPFALGEYKDWVSTTSFIDDTAPTPVINNAADRLRYRARLRFDNMQKAVYDSEAPNCTLTALATNLTVNDLRNARTQLKQLAVKPQAKFGNRYPVMAAPVVLYDLIRDPAAGGYLDIVKYNQNVNNTPLVSYNMDGDLADVAGCRIMETQNVTVDTTVTPNTYRVYVHGDGGFVHSTLRGKNTATPETRRFNVKIGKAEWDHSNPTGDIGSFAAYRCYFTAGCVANTALGDVSRSRFFDIPSTIA